MFPTSDGEYEKSNSLMLQINEGSTVNKNQFRSRIDRTWEDTGPGTGQKYTESSDPIPTALANISGGFLYSNTTDWRSFTQFI